MKNKSIVIVILILIVIGIAGYLVFNNLLKSDKFENPFSSTTETGKVEVLGYISTKKVNEVDCYSDTCKQYDYVFFNILETDNNEFLTYLEDSSGNTFVTKKAIGIGCIENNTLIYQNQSDELGMKDFSLSTSNTNKIMLSTKENPIKLELGKLKLTSGGFATTCYSHMTTIDVID